MNIQLQCLILPPCPWRRRTQSRRRSHSGDFRPDRHCQHQVRTGHGGEIPADLGFAQAISGAGMVSQRQVRHLGVLGAAMRAGGRRLVCAQHVCGRQREQNKFHVAHYGPPSQFGFKDVIHVWKAENWDPEKLVALYKRTGAQYFVAMANHHDNFDLWDSKYQPWNSREGWPAERHHRRLGPKRRTIKGCLSASASMPPMRGAGMKSPRAPTKPARSPACLTTAS